MLIKVVIIVGIVVVGVMMFSNEIQSFFPTASTTAFDSIKTDIGNLTLQASDSVEQRFDATINTIADQTNDSFTTQIGNVGELISDKISNATNSTLNAVDDGLSNLNPIESVTNIFKDDLNP